MLYCKRCQSVCEDYEHRCPNCKSNKLREVLEEDFVFLQRADLYTASRLESLFTEHDIDCRLEPFSKGRPAPLYDSEVMPTDKSVFVPFRDLPAARELSAALYRELEADEPAPQWEEMPRKKRLVVQSLSALAFIVLIICVVLAADGAAGWLKSLLGLG